LIAQKPVQVRSASRLLVLDRAEGKLIDSQFDQIGRYLRKGDCLVLNDTKVLPARFFARRRTGAELEGLFLAEQGPGLWLVMLKGARKVGLGESIRLKDTKGRDFCSAVLKEKLPSGRCRLELNVAEEAKSILEKIGYPPLPPYIKRGKDAAEVEVDRYRYQTVYARYNGAVAAPTAGLHFTGELIEQLKQGGIRFAFVTLHVGPGTFKPVTAEDLDDHQMEAEQFAIDEENAGIINRSKKEGGRIIAVGTTSVRVLETVAEKGRVRAESSWTGLFIKPGYEFKIVDAMVTNFHLPRTSLLALVAAFAGLDRILEAYRHAVRQRYRFYSYGDAMLIL